MCWGFYRASMCARTLCVSDVLLFVRGHISTRRGQRHCGNCLRPAGVAFEGAETSPPITEQDWRCIHRRERPIWVDVLVRVLKDEHYRTSLRNEAGWRTRSIFRGARLQRATLNL